MNRNLVSRERAFLLLARSGWEVSNRKAAQVLGFSRSGFFELKRRLKEWGLVDFEAGKSGVLNRPIIYKTTEAGLALLGRPEAQQGELLRKNMTNITVNFVLNRQNINKN